MFHSQARKSKIRKTTMKYIRKLSLTQHILQCSFVYEEGGEALYRGGSIELLRSTYNTFNTYIISYAPEPVDTSDKPVSIKYLF